MIFAATPLPVVVRVTQPGPSWLELVVSLLGSFLLGTATAVLIQLFFVPRVEARKRREDRWESDVRQLSEFLTTTVTELANDVRAAQSVFRMAREDQSNADSRAVDRLASEAEQAVWVYGDALTRLRLLVSRVVSFRPKASEIQGLDDAAIAFRVQSMLVRTLRDDSRSESKFKEHSNQERDARDALIERVNELERLPRPPR